MKNVIMVFLLVAFLSISAFADNEAVKSIEDFVLPGSDGQSHAFSDYKDAKAVVVLFISTKCPVSNGFNARMAELAKAYESKGVVFLGINSNKAETLAEAKNHAKTNGFSFVVLKDENNILADQFKAKVTPEAFVLNTQGEIIYHGRIDDSPEADERKAEDLKSALDQVLDGNAVAVAETKAFGCSIKRVAK